MKNFVLVLFAAFTFFSVTVSAQNKVLLLDGVDDYVQINDDGFFNFSRMTIEMCFYWSNTDMTTTSDVEFLIGKATEDFEIHTEGESGTHALRFIPTTKVYLDTPPNTFNPNQWYHIAFVYDPYFDDPETPEADGLGRCYVNGNRVSLIKRGDNPTTTTLQENLSTPLLLGSRAGGVYGKFNGMLDEVRLWTTVRTQQEIQNNMNHELTGGEDGLFAYYNMSSNDGGIIHDINFMDLDGTLINGAQIVNNDYSLPVELTSFTAKQNGSGVMLSWATATEVDNMGFEVEKKSLGTESWQKIGFVEGAGNSNSPRAYSFTDKILSPGKLVYRLKQLNSDGSYSYSPEVSATVSAPGEFALKNYPNPFNPATTISYTLPYDCSLRIDVYDMLGQLAASLVNRQETAGVKEVRWNAENFPSGTYILRMQALGDDGSKFSTSQKLLLMK